MKNDYVVLEKWGGLFRDKGNEFVGITDVAATLRARDYKGWSNLEYNTGVIELVRYEEEDGMSRNSFISK